MNTQVNYLCYSVLHVTL